jgi:hypothetical protein
MVASGQLAPLNLPGASLFVASYRNFVGIAAMLGAFLFSQTLFARLGQFATCVSP